MKWLEERTWFNTSIIINLNWLLVLTRSRKKEASEKNWTVSQKSNLRSGFTIMNSQQPVMFGSSCCFDPTPFDHSQNQSPTTVMGYDTMEAVFRTVEETLEPFENVLDPTPINTQSIQIVDNVGLSSWSPDQQRTIATFASLWRKQQSLSLPSSSTTIYEAERSMPPKLCYEGELNRKIDTTFGRSLEELVMADTKLIPPKIDCTPTVMLSSDSSNKLSFRYRPYKQDLWNDRFQDLKKFQKLHGHCLVPNNWEENPPLAQWVKRERYQYKLRKQGRHSTMTDKRIKNLEELGFVWSSHGATWEERYEELVQYAKEHGHCNVPSSFPENHQLAVWVKCQRRQFKRNCCPKDRYNKLQDLGFVWDHRKLALGRKQTSWERR